MNRRRAWLSSAVTAAAMLIACSPQSQTDGVTLDLGDVEDYADFLEARGDVVEPKPFKPEPLRVSAIGKVQAQPDIAVITATITAEDKNESRAVNAMGEIINQVQTALAGRKIETGFTAINSTRKFDETCRNDNRFAVRRHNQIRQDYNFNQRLDRQGDTKTKRRAPKPRVAQQVCKAQKIETSTDMVIRIQPANAAGDVLQALSNAGAKNSRLFGYDFTDYDALYREAAAKAVSLAREKAETVARVAGGTLGEIESFSVSAPERQGRFGPQPNVIRPANRYEGEDGSAVDRYIENYEYFNSYASPPQPLSFGNIAPGDELVLTAQKRTSKSRPYQVSVSDIENESISLSQGGEDNVTERFVLNTVDRVHQPPFWPANHIRGGATRLYL